MSAINNNMNDGSGNIKKEGNNNNGSSSNNNNNDNSDAVRRGYAHGYVRGYNNPNFRFPRAWANNGTGAADAFIRGQYAGKRDALAGNPPQYTEKDLEQFRGGRRKSRRQAHRKSKKTRRHHKKH